MGLDTIIANAMQSEQSGSVVLEELLRSNPCDAPGYSSFKLQELIAITCWYIWWIRRKRTHGESVPPSFKCATSIRGLAANYARAKKVQNQVAKKTWEKPRAMFLMLLSTKMIRLVHQVHAIIRDSTEAFVAASSKFIPHVATVVMAEALAMVSWLGASSIYWGQCTRSTI
jgi:hypothetical protein